MVLRYVSIMALCGLALPALGQKASEECDANTLVDVRGVVVNEELEVVAGARVEYREHGLNLKNDTSGDVLEATTDAQGRFLFAQSGCWGIIRVYAEGYRRALKRWDPTIDEETVLITLGLPYNLNVKIEGVPGGHVRFSYSDGALVLGNSEIAQDGSFRLEGLAPTEVKVLASFEGGYAPAVYKVNVEPTSSEKTVVFSEPLRAGAVSGRITFEGEPVPGVRVSVNYPVDLDYGWFFEQVVDYGYPTGYDGVFRLEGLMPNTPISLGDTCVLELAPGEVKEGVEIRIGEGC